MKCRNCQNETYEVIFEHKVARQLYEKDPRLATLERLPVKLTCTKCGHRVKAWITNEQMRALTGAIKKLEETVENLMEIRLIVPEKKPFFRRILDWQRHKEP